MTTPFGPQLIGETEKTLQALLRRALAGTGLDERLWVALRAASQPDGTALRQRLAERAHFADADELVATLEQRGLVAGDALTADGQAMLDRVLARTAELTGPIWDDLDDADAAARALNQVLARAHAALAKSA
jgi:hypothetical protein